MVSYIFANKTKNIIVMIFASLLLLNNLYDIVSYIGESSAFPFYKTLAFLPFVLLFVYLLTLKKQYKFKNYLLPVAFAYRIIKSSYIVFINLREWFYSRLTFEYVISIVSLDIIILAGFILCLLGALQNFKKPQFFKFGMLIIAITELFVPLVSFILVGGFEYLASVPDGYQAISYPVLIECFVFALYYFSLFSLTLNKNE